MAGKLHQLSEEPGPELSRAFMRCSDAINALVLWGQCSTDLAVEFGGSVSEATYLPEHACKSGISFVIMSGLDANCACINFSPAASSALIEISANFSKSALPRCSAIAPTMQPHVASGSPRPMQASTAALLSLSDSLAPQDTMIGKAQAIANAIFNMMIAPESVSSKQIGLARLALMFWASQH